MRQCSFCGGLLYLLGILGNLVHVRCRDCGGQFHTLKKEGEDYGKEN